jgi:competence ComEA-like helix-hairpin-helix protein
MPDESRKLPWLSSGDRWVLALVFGALLALLGVHYALRRGAGGPDATLERGPPVRSHRLDVNTAEWWQLQAMQGIGETRARDIVAYRRRHGRFTSPDDLTRVPGIGPKTVDRLRPFLIVHPPEPTDEEAR